MQRAERLKQDQDFVAVYRQGKQFRDKLLVLRTLRTGRDESRVGFTAGRALGNAVVRNRVKRRLRAAVRSLSLDGGWDIVFNARQGTNGADNQQLRSAVVRCSTWAGVLLWPTA